MRENYKDDILKFIKNFHEKGTSLKEISEGLGVSYPTISKWIEVLSVENLIKVRDYGNVKIVYYKDGK